MANRLNEGSFDRRWDGYLLNKFERQSIDPGHVEADLLTVHDQGVLTGESRPVVQKYL